VYRNAANFTESQSNPFKGETAGSGWQLKSTHVWGLSDFDVVWARLVGKSWTFLQVGLGWLADLFDS
jgi:hypothetical protein